MKILGFEITRVSEDRATLKDAPRWLQEALGAMETASGVSINEENAMKIAAVFGSVRILSESVAFLPLKLFRRLDRGREVARDHPLFLILHSDGNDLMTSFTLRRTMMVHLTLWGNAYLEVQLNGRGDVAALWPIHPARVEDVKIKDEKTRPRKEFLIRMKDGTRQRFGDDRILHIPGMGFDGIMGKSPIRMARESLGISIAAEKYGANFFKNDGRPGGVLQTDKKLTEEGYELMAASWKAAHQGPGNSHKIAILEQGTTFNDVGLPPEDMQFLQTRKFQIAEVARMFRVPLHKLQELDRATFNNIEHLSLEFIMDSLSPWFVCIEQAFNKHLLLPSEKSTYYIEHVVAGLLRGDMKSRGESYAQGRQWGWLSANDVRELENMNPVEGGDEYLRPMNMVPAGQPQTVNDRFALRRIADYAPGERRARESRADEPFPPRYRIARAMLPVLLDAFHRTNKREVVEIRRAVEKYLQPGDVSGFRSWLEDFESEHAEWMLSRVQPIFDMFAAQMAEAARDEIGDGVEPEDLQPFVRDYSESFANRHAASSRAQLEAILAEERSAVELRQIDEQVIEDVEERLASWEESRAETEANRERVRASNAFTKAAWGLLGVLTLGWRNVGSETCPMCERFDGREVSIDGFFAMDGDVVDNPAGTALRVFGNVGHPPLHDGCDCILMPIIG